MTGVLRRQRGSLCLVLLGTVAVLAPRPGKASPPPTMALSPRELLALSPQAVGELPEPARDRARERLSRALADQAAADLKPMLLPQEPRLPPAVQLPLTPSLQRVLALDLLRRARTEDPVLVAVLLKTALKPLAAPGLLDAPAPPREPSARLLLPAALAPGGAAALRGLCERAAAQWPTLLSGATVRLVAGVPFAVLLSQPERVVYVNPVVLTLLTAQTPPGAGAAAASPLSGDPERELTYRSVADCAHKVQARCQACLRGDAAECAAVRGTLAGVACPEVVSDLGKLSVLCIDRAVSLLSVADCVVRSDPACSSDTHAPRCREIVDRCIATPSAGPPRDSSGGREPAGLACLDCTFTACGTLNRGCATSCGELGRQACQPLGESCSDKVGQGCTENCNDCNGECTKGCRSSCAGCNQGCQGCGSECTRDCASCSRSCNRCSGECNQCSNDCNQCSSDCSQCNSECNQCSSQCSSCGSECNQCNSQCSSCGNQCSVVQVGGGYPRFPTPPGPADPPPPLARLLLGARGTVAMILPPLLFLWWRRRLPATRRRSETTE